MARNEIRLMEAAIALAEELNFSRAARRLRVTQPALTKQIAELETRLGFPLFQRTHQAVAINDAGRAYVEEARISVLHSERAMQAARTALNDTEVVLHVGKSPYTDPFLTTMLMAVRLPLYPHLKLELMSGFSYELVHELLERKLDIALVTEPPESPMLSMTKVSESPFYVALSKHNELAGSPALTFEQLNGESWIIFARRLHPPLYDLIMALAESRRVRARHLHHIMVPEEASQFIMEHNGVAFLTKGGALRVARDGVTLRPLAEDQLLLKTYLAARADNKSKVAGELVRAFGRKVRTIEGEAQLKLPISA